MTCPLCNSILHVIVDDEGLDAHLHCQKCQHEFADMEEVEEERLFKRVFEIRKTLMEVDGRWN